MTVPMTQLTLAPSDFSISTKIGLASSPSAVRTSTNATTPLKHLFSVVFNRIAAKDRSPACSSSGAMDVSNGAVVSGTIDCRGRCTLDSLDVEATTDVIGCLKADGPAGFTLLAGAAKVADIDCLGRFGSDCDSDLRIFSLFRASDKPAIDLDVSVDMPSRRDVEAESSVRGLARGAGSETDRGDCRPWGIDNSPLDVARVPSR